MKYFIEQKQVAQAIEIIGEIPLRYSLGLFSLFQQLQQQEIREKEEANSSPSPLPEANKN